MLSKMGSRSLQPKEGIHPPGFDNIRFFPSILSHSPQPIQLLARKGPAQLYIRKRSLSRNV